jgi:hypothetical protein
MRRDTQEEWWSYDTKPIWVMPVMTEVVEMERKDAHRPRWFALAALAGLAVLTAACLAAL